MDHFTAAADLVSSTLSATFSADVPAADIAALMQVPKDSSHGEVACPCFTFAKTLRKAPQQIAADLAAAIEPQLGESVFAAVEQAGPYLNFRLDMGRLAAWLLPSAIRGEITARRPERGERVMIEYSQPNTHKAFHVGHMRNVALGDACVRICEWAGYDVVAANYIGDVGAHVAKCLWILRDHFDGEIPDTNRGEFLGLLYSQGVNLLDFKRLTRAPLPGVVTAEVVAIEPHPTNATWKVVSVSHGGDRHTCVCGGKGYALGDIVAFATLGSRIRGRRVEETDKDGVTSAGMVCSDVELGLGDTGDIHVFEPGTPLDTEIAEVLRVEGAVPGRAVVDVIREREAEVSAVLQALERGDPEVTALWERTRQWSLDEFDAIYAWLAARFDHVFYESECAEPGKAIVKKYLEDGVFVRSEGAVGADLSRFDLPFFLLLKSDGTGLYSTKDLALASIKFDQFGVDKSVYVVDSSQSLHFQQVFRTLELMGYEKAALCHHLPYGLVVLPDGKMSSRKGNVILFSQLKQGLIDRLRSEYLDKHDWPEEDIQETARRLAIATIRYGMLNQDNLKQIVFDLEEWISATGNTGPYLMYAHARIASILRELGDVRGQVAADYEALTHPTEQELLRLFLDFERTVLRAAEGYRPQVVCMYLYDLTKAFNRMYKHCPVLRAEPPLRQARAELVEATGVLIRDALALIGIEAVDRM